MPRSQGFALTNNFAKGLISEASALSFPKDTCIETFNCVHNLNGSVERREGFRIELNHSTRVVDRTDGVVGTYFWKDVTGDGDLILVVVQIGATLYFYNADTTDPYIGSPSNPLSANPITATIDLTDFSPAGAPSPATQECQFAAGNGKLFVTHPYLEPFSVSFDTNTETFTSAAVTIQIRDFEGLSETSEISERPTVGLGGVTVAHHYNLLNQGWTAANLITWDTNRTDLPSNSDVMWRFKNSSDVFDTATVDNVISGNSPASKGHYILDAFNKQRDTASGLVIADETAGYQRPSCVAFYAGRLFYAGINFENYNSKVYFSQIIEREEQYGQCYQVNDPTAEDLFDLLPTDGGAINVQEAGTIIKMVVVPGGLILFCSNGIWMITGSTGLGFTATDYTITKISSIATITQTSFTDLQGLPAWWNLEGIYRLDGGGNGAYQVVSLTDTTIKSMYDDIPPSEKRNARGYYNPVKKVVQWLYRDTEAGDLEEYYNYQKILNLDLRTGGFYIWTIPDHEVSVHGMVVLENRGGNAALENVTDNSSEILHDNDGNVVQSWTIGDAIVIPRFKYVVSYVSSGDTLLTFGETSDNSNWKDWVEYGVTEDYDSYFRTGYAIQNAMTDFQSNYLTLYVDNNSVVDIKGIWNFANSGNSGRWSVPQRVNSTAETYFDYKPYRRKIRGSGKSLQIQINSVSGEPFKLSGWSVYLTGNQTP